jgi:hypothetical protein
MNDHSVFEEMLARRDELTTPEEAVLQQHLALCSGCRQDATAYAELDSLLRARAEAEETDELLHAVQVRVRRSITHQRSPVGPVARRFLWTIPTAAVLVMAALLAVHSHLPSGSHRAVVPPNPVAPARPAPSSSPGAAAPPRPSTTSPSPRTGIVPGVGLERPHVKARVPSSAAVQVVRRRWPRAHIRKVTLALVRAPNMPAVNGRLCWVVSAAGGIPQVGRGQLFVFVDARSGRFVLAESGGKA